MAGQMGNVHRGNVVPQGGVTPNQVGGAVGGGMIMPDTLQLQEMSDIFMENSEQNYLQFSSVPLVSGQTANFNLQTVGLGEGLELLIEGWIDIRNTHASLVETVNLQPDFPYNILRNVTLIFNGQATLVQASAYDLLMMMIKRNVKSGFARSINHAARLDRRICEVTATSGTLVNGHGLTGFHQLTIPANTTARVNVRFYLDLSFVLRKDLLIGLLPMANTSVHANVELMVAPMVGTTPDFPFHGSANLSLIGSNVNVTPVYKFWALPKNRALYEQFVNTSYVVTRFANKSIAAVGEKAISFEVPINFWLVSALMTIRNQARTLVDVTANLNNPHLVYNGTISVDRSPIAVKTARDFIFYGLEAPTGHLIFDYANTGNLHGNSANMSKWLNMYQASNPVLYADVMAGFTVPGSYDVTLERLAPNHVQVI